MLTSTCGQQMLQFKRLGQLAPGRVDLATVFLRLWRDRRSFGISGHLDLSSIGLISAEIGRAAFWVLRPQKGTLAVCAGDRVSLTSGLYANVKKSPESVRPGNEHSFVRSAVRLQHFATRLIRIARSTHKAYSLSSAQFSVMALLNANPSMTVVELARREQVSHPTMSRLIAGLVRISLVSRTTNRDASSTKRKYDLLGRDQATRLRTH